MAETELQEKTADPKVESEARGMGWVPETEFKGDMTRWVDAKTFVDRGHTVLPIVTAKNKALEAKLSALAAENEETKRLLKASQESIEALEEFHNANTKRQVEKARGDLLAAKKAAKRDGDTDAEVELDGELSRLDAATAAAEKEPKKKAEEPKAMPPKPDPAYLSWRANNPWFEADKRKTRFALVIGREIKEENPHLYNESFYQELDKRLAEEPEFAPVRGEDKVEGSRGGAGGSGGGGGSKTYAGLPADAKAACDEYNDRLVGAGRRYKTIAEWRKVYVEKFYEGA